MWPPRFSPMRALLEFLLLGLAACVCSLACYWAWQEIIQWRSRRHERRTGRRTTRHPLPE